MLKLQPLVPMVVEALNGLSAYEIKAFHEDVLHTANVKPRLRPAVLFRHNILYYLFSSNRICEWYNNYDCTDKHIDALLKEAFKKSNVPDLDLKFHIFADYGYVTQELLKECDTKQEALNFFNDEMVKGNFDRYHIVEMAHFDQNGEYVTHTSFDNRN